MLFTVFKDRTDAGMDLADSLEIYAGRKDIAVLGLPRGGMPVAFAIAKRLRAPLDVLIVGKVGFPSNPELALGAVTSEGPMALNRELVESSGIDMAEVEAIAHRKRIELERKESLYRRGEPAVPVRGRIVILVDDGVATGATMRAAVQALRRLDPEKVIAAFPVASGDGLQAIRREADETVCLHTPDPFHSVGEWYRDFREVGDADVMDCLARSESWMSPAHSEGIPESRHPGSSIALRIPAGGVELPADLTLPKQPRGLILFAHGSGSGRRSIRNRQVARALNKAGFATLLMDLLTREEEIVDRETAEYRFNVDMLAERLIGATRWAAEDSRLRDLPVGYFGGSTGAAAAMMAAARTPTPVAAVVSRGGRPDLAAAALPDLAVPTLLMVGSEDETVLELNRHAMESMRCGKHLEIILGASHLFEEPGAMDAVSGLAAGWFARHLRRGGPGNSSV